MTKTCIYVALAAVLLSSACHAGPREERRAAIAALQSRAEELVETADVAFATMGAEKTTDERSRELRAQARAAVDEAIVTLDELIEKYPDEERWAEEVLERVFAVSFWIDRFTTLDDLDYEAMLEESKQANKSNDFTAESAMTAAVAAQQKGDEAAAFYGYLEVATQHALEDSDRAQEARGKLLEMRETLTTEQLLSHLKRELKSDDPQARLFAAEEMASLRTSYVADPLARALRSEDDEDVQNAILAAFHHTAKRASGKALDLLARSKDSDLKLRVLDTLEQGVGGRHGALAAKGFVGDSDPAVTERAVRALVAIGGPGASQALGKLAGGRNDARMQKRLFGALVSVGNPEAAEALIPFCTSRNPWREDAEDALVKIGEPALLPCILSFKNSRVRKHAHDVLRRITDQTTGMNSDKWLEWYQRWTATGGGVLPRYQRGSEPWMGGDGRSYPTNPSGS